MSAELQRRLEQIHGLLNTAALERRTYHAAQIVELARLPDSVEVTEAVALEVVGQPAIAIDDITPAAIDAAIDEVAASGGACGVRH